MIRSGEAMDRHTVTVNERLLLHLWECSSNREVMDAPFALTQEGIARALGIRVNHVSRAVKALQEQRCVTESTAHVHGESRKRKVYLISHEGLTAAQSLVRESGRRTATVKDERGATREAPLTDAWQARGECGSASRSFWSPARAGGGSGAIIRALGGFLSCIGRPELSARLMERMSRVSEVSGILERDWPASGAILVLDGADAVPEV